MRFRSPFRCKYLYNPPQKPQFLILLFQSIHVIIITSYTIRCIKSTFFDITNGGYDMSRKSKKIVSLALTFSLLAALPTGAYVSADALESTAEYSFAEEAADAAADSMAEDAAVLPAADSLPADVESVAEAAEGPAFYPWLNSNILKIVTPDTAADLRDDFYLGVNRDWLSTAEPIPGYPYASSFVTLTDEINKKLLGLMTDKSLTSHDAQLLQSAYELFLDWDTRNELGADPLLPHVEAIEAISSLDELTEYLVSDEGIYYGDGFWSIGLGYDSADSSRYDLEINSLSLSLGDSAEYEQMTPNGQMTKQAHDAMVLWMLKKTGHSEEEAQALIDECYAFEEKLAPSVMTVAERTSPDAIEKSINPVTFEDLKEICTSYPLPAILEAANCADWELINLNEPAWLEKMNELYTEENLEGIKAYILTTYVGSYMSIVDEESFREYQRISRERTGASESLTDEMNAYNYAGAVLNTSLSKVFVEKYMTPEIREDIRSIIGEVIDTYRVMLGEEDWLSEETRAKAVEKLDHITVNAAYPDKWEDTESIEFAGKDDGGNLFELTEAISRYSIGLFDSKKNTTVDPEIWNFGVTDVNAYYNPADNSINIIAGILGSPFYSENMSVEEKLGGIGMVIGHEISHAFDTGGAQFDLNGNFANWWAPEDYSAFTERAQKLINYYNSIVPMEGISYSGDMVQGEAIADMGGIKCMLRIAKDIEGFDYEKFFRSFADVWKSAYTPEIEQMLIAQDTHPLDYLRVNVTCMQFPEFQETFGIQEGDGMYLAPEDRICVW